MTRFFSAPVAACGSTPDGGSETGSASTASSTVAATTTAITTAPPPGPTIATTTTGVVSTRLPTSDCDFVCMGDTPIECDPIAQDCDPQVDDCGDDGVCVPANATGFYCSVDASMGEGGIGTPCAYDSQCADVGVCPPTVNFPHPGCAQASSSCLPYCDVNGGENGNPGCAPYEEDVPGLGCYSLFGDAVPEFEHVGICRVP